MAGLRDVLALLIERADEQLPAGFYTAISVPPERVRDRLRKNRRAFFDPDAPTPELRDVDETARWVVEQSSLRAASLGGFAGVGGAISVPPEALASAIATLRLAQRLAIVYGFDPETDRGQMAVWKALGAGLELVLPMQGPLQVRIRDLPQMLAPVAVQSASAELTRAVLWSSLATIARFTRVLPIVGPAFGAVSARRRTQEVGERMMGALRRIVDVPGDLPPIEDAFEIP